LSAENSKNQESINKASESMVKLLESGLEICLIAFDRSGAYNVFAYFSDEESIHALFDVINKMRKDILNSVTSSNNPNHWSYKEGNA